MTGYARSNAGMKPKTCKVLIHTLSKRVEHCSSVMESWSLWRPAVEGDGDTQSVGQITRHCSVDAPTPRAKVLCFP